MLGVISGVTSLVLPFSVNGEHGSPKDLAGSC